MERILVILGLTSTGKTDLALRLAKKFNGELVSCDSRQLYKGLDIGTGKLPGQEVKVKKGEGFWDMDGVKVWMYDVVNPKRQYTVYDYVKDASEVIVEIRSRGKLPIIVGGTGLYLKALLEGLPSLAIPVDLKLRKQLNNLTMKQLQQRLQGLDRDKWRSLNESDRQNPRRLIRAIEISSIRIPPRSNFVTPRRWSEYSSLRGGFNTLKIGLTAPREILYRRIDERVVSRIDQGRIDEAKRLHKKGLTFKRMRELGLEYGVLVSYLEGKIINREELIKMMQGKVHGFTRRQLTWFKKEKNVFWFDISHKNYADKVENLVAKWYDIHKYAAKS